MKLVALVLSSFNTRKCDVIIFKNSSDTRRPHSRLLVILEDQFKTSSDIRSTLSNIHVHIKGVALVL